MGKKVRAGDWFAVPLRDGGWCVGVVSRGRRGVLVCYFFGPKRTRLPQMSDVSALRPADADLIAKVGDLSLSRGEWPILGRLASWSASDWPIPVFARFEELTGRYLRVSYDDEDPTKVQSEQAVSQSEAKSLPEDGLMGAGFAQQYLSDHLIA